MEKLIVSQNDLFAQFKSIQEAIQAAEPGAIICIDPGFYEETIFLDKNLVLVGNGTPEEIIIQSQEVACISIDTNSVNVSSITFQGLGETNQYGLMIHSGEHIFKNCVFSSTGASVLLGAEDQTSFFEKCLFHKSKWGFVTSFASNCRVIESTITRNTEVGFKPGLNTNPIFQNTIISNNRLGVYFEEKANGTLEGCQFSFNTLGVQINNMSAPIFNSCLFDRNEVHFDIHNGIGIIHSCNISGGKIGLNAFNHSHVNITASSIEHTQKHNIWVDTSTINMKDSKLTNSPIGLYVNQAIQSLVETTNFTKHSEAGIMLEEENEILVKSSQINGAECGVCFQKQATGTLEEMLIESSVLSGIAILEGSHPQIEKCTIKNGQQTGLFIWNASGNVKESRFLNNAQINVLEEGSNTIHFNQCFNDEVNQTNDLNFIEAEKSIGTDEETLESILKELHSYIGLNQVKNRVNDIIDFVTYTKERSAAGISSVPSISHHSIFLGKPGTGKTTIARLLSKIFYHLGVLETDHLVEVDRAGLVGEYVGQTAIKTHQVIDKAKGGVLFIDEAYTLIKSETGSDYGKEALEIILKRMEDDPSFIVIAAGYPEEMKSFIDANPGLKDRFKNHFHFDDFTPDQLLQIFEKMLQEEEYLTSTYPKEIVLQEFTDLYRKRDRSFGNARMVRTFFEDVKMNHAKRCVRLGHVERTVEVLRTITNEDIEQLLVRNRTRQHVPIPVNKDRLAQLVGKLQSLIGLERVKQEVQNIIKLVEYYREEGRDYTGQFVPHTVFLGNPGTGKTTVARLLSQIYEALGLLPVGDLIETSREDLVAGYVGQTALKTTEVLNRALGSTLFIDEAYTLTRKNQHHSDYGQESIDTILKRMEDDRGKFVLIAAGYTDEMVSFLQSNPGLQSRFGQVIVFDDYNPKEMVHIAEMIAREMDFCFDEQAVTDLFEYFEEQYLNRDRYFSNARFVRNVVETAIKQATLRIADVPKELRASKNTIIRTDLPFLKKFV